jgi:predicted O-methyltransferase YrrM
VIKTLKELYKEQGWEQFSPEDVKNTLKLLEKVAKPGMVVIEVGTFIGSSAFAMLPMIKSFDGRLLCVDWFVGTGEKTLDEVTLFSLKHDILSILRHNLQLEGYLDRVEILVGDSGKSHRWIANRTADFIFIDGDHRYTGCKSDLEGWFPKLKRDGIIAGHDFDVRMEELPPGFVDEFCERDCQFLEDKGHVHCGVIKAVNEFFGNFDLDGRIWSFQNKQSRPGAIY